MKSVSEDGKTGTKTSSPGFQHCPGQGAELLFSIEKTLPRTQLLGKNPNDGGKTVRDRKRRDIKGQDLQVVSEELQSQDGAAGGEARSGGRPEGRGQGSVEVGLH